MATKILCSLTSLKFDDIGDGQAPIYRDWGYLSEANKSLSFDLSARKMQQLGWKSADINVTFAMVDHGSGQVTVVQHVVPVVSVPDEIKGMTLEQMGLRADCKDVTPVQSVEEAKDLAIQAAQETQAEVQSTITSGQ